jgi:ABC-type spermidine/putrescine transport system permease subunit II
VTPEINAIATSVLLVTLTLLIVAQVLLRRAPKKQSPGTKGATA